MKENRYKDALKKYYKNIIRQFDAYSIDPDDFNRIFTELWFTHVEEGCEGFCLECEKILECETYKEFKGDWDSLCS